MRYWCSIILALSVFTACVYADGADTVTVEYDTVAFDVCMTDFPVVYDSIEYAEGGLYFVEHIDTAYYLLLKSRPVYNDTIKDTVRQGRVYDKNGFYLTAQGVYTKELTSMYGCDSVVSLDLTVWDDMYTLFPNTFTPQGENNNFFTYWVSDSLNFELESFEIFDRKGTRVFYTNKKYDYWDGTYNGKVCETSVFVYRMFYRYRFTKGRLYEKHGEVILLR